MYDDEDILEHMIADFIHQESLSMAIRRPFQVTFLKSFTF